MSLLIRMFVSVVLWVVLGQVVTHFFFPELWESKSALTTLPWLLLIGYGVGTVASSLADLAGESFKRD